MRYDVTRVVKPIDRPQHISLLLPTRGRPDFLNKVFDSVAKTVGDADGIDAWVYVDHDDPVTKQYFQSESHLRYPFKVNCVLGERTLSQGQMVNVLRERCTTNPGIYLPCADDYVFTSANWDGAIRAAFDQYPDRIVLGYIPQPNLPAEQVIWPVLTAEWTNVTGRIFTEFFPFWSDDTWLDHVSQMVGKKVRIEMKAEPISGEGKASRLKNLPFWQSLFTGLMDERLAEAKLLLRAIYPQDCPEYQQRIKEAQRFAEAITEQREKVTVSYLSALEKKHSAFPKDPEPHLMLVHAALEAKAVAHLFTKTDSLMQGGDFNKALKMLATIGLAEQQYKDAECLRAACLKRLESATTGSQSEEPKFSFVMIVLNGMPFIEYSLKSIYGFAHEVIIVEGAVEKCMFAANPDGSSTDGTVQFIKSFPDPQNKIRLIQGRWPEKCQMQNEALKHVSGDYVWLIDSDEVYKREDLDKMKRILTDDPSITQVNFIPDNFWKGLDYIFVSPRFFEPACHYRRLFKYVRGAVFTSHRPPTMMWPGDEHTTEQMHLLDGRTTREMGIVPYHYSYVRDEQVQQKIELYRRYGWGKDWKLDLVEWYNQCFLKWTPENRHATEQRYPVWTGDRNSRTQLFTGTHPEVMTGFTDKPLQKEARPKGQTLHAIGDTNFQNKVVQAKRVRVAADYVQAGTQIGTESSFGAELRKLFASLRPRKIIETGTYLGMGTTTIIAKALEALSIRDAVFYTIEVNPQNYASAKEYFAAGNMNVQALNGLSVPRSKLPDRGEIACKTIRDVDFDGIFVDHSEQNRVALYYGETDFPHVEDDLLYKCLERFDFRPDFVLLDSGGHMGSIEFDYLIENLRGECYIALDDIYHVKHHRSFQVIQSDPRFEVITASKEKFGFCIARFTPKAQVRAQAVRHLLWVRTDSIGDAILASSMLPLLRGKYNNPKITVVCRSHIAELYESCPYVDAVLTFDEKRMLSDPAYASGLLEKVKSLGVDCALNPVYSRDVICDLMVAASGARLRIGMHGNLCNLSEELRTKHNQWYTELLPSDGERKPELQRHVDFLHGLGCKVDTLTPQLWLKPKDEAFADQWFRREGPDPRETVALFAGVQSPERIYTEYGKAIAAVCRENGFSVIALGAGNDRELNRRNLKDIENAGVRVFDLTGALTLRQSAAIIKRCRLAVGAETGLAHMAATVGTPHVIVIGGGQFGRFMPYSAQTSLVCLPLDCYGCGWKCKHRDSQIYCITSIAPALVERAVRQTL